VSYADQPAPIEALRLKEQTMQLLVRPSDSTLPQSYGFQLLRFRIDRPEGFAIRKVYTQDRRLDEIWRDRDSRLPQVTMDMER
jgi:hypothetical protein